MGTVWCVRTPRRSFVQRLSMKPRLLRSTVTLLSGGLLANALPLLLGPALTRLYTPEDFGQYALLWAVATNLAVVGCARYEFALPLERSPLRAALLMALCARLLVTVAAASTLVALALFWAQNLALAWILPVSVLAIGATQWLTLWATHNLRFGLLATARFVQQGGGSRCCWAPSRRGLADCCWRLCSQVWPQPGCLHGLRHWVAGKGCGASHGSGCGPWQCATVTFRSSTPRMPSWERCKTP